MSTTEFTLVINARVPAGTPGFALPALLVRMEDAASAALRAEGAVIGDSDVRRGWDSINYATCTG